MHVRSAAVGLFDLPPLIGRLKYSAAKTAVGRTAGSSLFDHSNVDKDGNLVVRGDLFSYKNKGTIFNISPGKVAVVQGLEGYIVIDSDDVLLVVKKEEEQNIKHYLDDVKKSTKEKYL